MDEHAPAEWCWEIGTDPEEVHALLVASDEYQAAQSGSPAPQRSPAGTAERVRAGLVHVLRYRGEAVAMFTLSWQPPFDQDLEVFPAAAKPAYLQRLAVAPAHLGKGSVFGVQCIRKAVELAGDAGADALRAEANPDLSDTWKLLRLLGFSQHGSTLSEAGRRRAYLQKTLGDG